MEGVIRGRGREVEEKDEESRRKERGRREEEEEERMEVQKGEVEEKNGK